MLYQAVQYMRFDNLHAQFKINSAPFAVEFNWYVQFDLHTHTYVQNSFLIHILFIYLFIL